VGGREDGGDGESCGIGYTLWYCWYSPFLNFILLLISFPFLAHSGLALSFLLYCILPDHYSFLFDPSCFYQVVHFFPFFYGRYIIRVSIQDAHACQSVFTKQQVSYKNLARAKIKSTKIDLRYSQVTLNSRSYHTRHVLYKDR
jgi:hypothetical protein